MLDIGRYDFKFICFIEPSRNDDGTIQEFFPQERYRNVRGLSLNRYGGGPFCKFKIPKNITKPGVYAMATERSVQYIGECENLSQRFNMGYGNISPRNCFVGGQETNCRLNHLILQEIQKGIRVALWFHQTNEFKKVEAELRTTQAFAWNRDGCRKRAHH